MACEMAVCEVPLYQNLVLGVCGRVACEMVVCEVLEYHKLGVYALVACEMVVYDVLLIRKLVACEKMAVCELVVVCHEWAVFAQQGRKWQEPPVLLGRVVA